MVRALCRKKAPWFRSDYTAHPRNASGQASVA